MDDTIGRLITNADFDAVDVHTRKALAGGEVDVSAPDSVASIQPIDSPEPLAGAGQVRDRLKMAVKAI